MRGAVSVSRIILIFSWWPYTSSKLEKNVFKYVDETLSVRNDRKPVVARVSRAEFKVCSETKTCD